MMYIGTMPVRTLISAISLGISAIEILFIQLFSSTTGKSKITTPAAYAFACPLCTRIAVSWDLTTRKLIW